MTFDLIQQILDKSPRLAAGLMCGTSRDGIDVVLVELEGWGVKTKWRQVHFESVPLPAYLVNNESWPEPSSAGGVSELNFLAGEAFADAVLLALEDRKKPKESLDFVGSHGITLFHKPPGGEGAASTLQIGEGAVIADRVGCVTVSDFRPADMAAGGQGAPLIPHVDEILFGDSDKARVCLNPGGIANVTYLEPGGEAEVAFDTGPGNMLIDEAVRRMTEGEAAFDLDGIIAQSGKVDDRFLKDVLMSHPFLGQPPPKSTGREEFGRDFYEEISRLWSGSQEDWVATLTAFTADTIADAVDRFVPESEEKGEVIVSGGGVHNQAIMSRLTERLSDWEVITSDRLGVDPDAKEALGFAILANETLAGRPANSPKLTGARHRSILGKISLPPP